MDRLLDRIKNVQAAFTRSQNVIAQYIDNNYNQLAFCSLETLAENIGVSTTTVIRFARVLGYEGFTEMQKALQNELQKRPSLPERLKELSDTPQLLADSFSKDIENIRLTLQAQNSEDLSGTIDSIIAAEKLYIIGLRGSFAPAYYMATRLAEIRGNVHLVRGTGELFAEEIVSATEKDLCIAFIFPRHSAQSLKMVDWLKEQGCKIVICGALGDETLMDRCSIFLPCSARSSSYKNSHAPTLSLINYIATAAAVRDPENAEKYLKRTETILAGDYSADI